eukprot:12219074-Alexandrium_andersonii.AAC.1
MLGLPLARDHLKFPPPSEEQLQQLPSAHGRWALAQIGLQGLTGQERPQGLRHGNMLRTPVCQLVRQRSDETSSDQAIKGTRS